MGKESFSLLPTGSLRWEADSVVRSPFTAAILALEMTNRHAAIFQLLLSGMMAQAIALLVDPHLLYEHLKASFMRETLDQPAPIAAARPQLSGA